MTHINAYLAEVSAAEQKVIEANGLLEEAKRQLREKEIEQGLPVTYPEVVEPEEQEAEVEADRKGKKS